MGDEVRGDRPQKFKDSKYDGGASKPSGNSSLDGSQSTALAFYSLLRAPCLSMLEVYLKAFSGKQSVRTALQDFREEHHYVVRTMYIVDQFFDFALLSVVIIVFLRGLGLIH